MLRPNSKSSRGWLSKVIVAAVILLLIAGVIGRMQSAGTPTPIPTPDLAGKLPSTLKPTVAQPRATSLAQSQPVSVDLPPGFVPAPWTTSLPTVVVLGTIDYVIDGDTFEIAVDGSTARYRIYHADAPETNPDVECGGLDATALVKVALWSSDTPGQVWIESVDQRDKYGRKLAYLWFTIDGQPYLLNYSLINSGWAEDIDYGDSFNPYRDQLRQAASAARDSRLGVWGLCGGFGIPAASSLAIATSAPVLEEMSRSDPR